MSAEGRRDVGPELQSHIGLSLPSVDAGHFVLPADVYYAILEEDLRSDVSFLVRLSLVCRLFRVLTKKWVSAMAAPAKTFANVPVSDFGWSNAECFFHDIGFFDRTSEFLSHEGASGYLVAFWSTRRRYKTYALVYTALIYATRRPGLRVAVLFNGKRLQCAMYELVRNIGQVARCLDLKERAHSDDRVLTLGNFSTIRFIGGIPRTADRANLLLIDEPELHFHATWQTKLLSTLASWQKERGGQVIIATQSNHLFQIADPDTKILLGAGNL